MANGQTQVGKVSSDEAMSGKVLIVEDQLDHRMILAVILSHLHYQVIEAADGMEGIDKAVTEAPDLIIMDLGLPGIDGLETTVQLKQNPKTAHIPVIAHTIWKEVEYRQKAHQAGIVEYLTKPTPPATFKHVLEKLLPPGP